MKASIINKRFAIVLVIILCVSFFPGYADGCWAGLTDEELIDQADLIIIGKIRGVLGEEQINAAEVYGTWVTKWDVEIYQMIKGEYAKKRITVLTPGADNKGVGTSLDYRLDIRGENVLLFLTQSEYGYQPLSPQGVIEVAVDHEKGTKYIFERYDVKQVNLETQLEQYIADNPINTDRQSIPKTYLLVFSVIIVSIVFVCSFVIFKKMKF